MLKYKQCMNLIEVAKPQEEDQASITVKSWLEKDNHDSSNWHRSIEIEVSGIVRERDRQWRETWKIPTDRKMNDELYQGLEELAGHYHSGHRTNKRYAKWKSIEVSREVKPGFCVGWMDVDDACYGFSRFTEGEHTMETRFEDLDDLMRLYNALTEAWSH